MNKPLAVAVILLFIGVAFAPSINANISKEMVEFTTEVCGLNGGKQTVKLTQEEAEEVEALFKSIRERLNATETREEAEEIFKEAVVELDKYGLLGGLSVEQVQRLVTGGYQNGRMIKPDERVFTHMTDDDYWDNFNCLIVGRTTDIWITKFSYHSLYAIFLNWLKENYPKLYLLYIPIGLILTIPYLIWFIITSLIPNAVPICYNSTVYFGLKYEGGFGSIGYFNCSGWIWTNGGNDIKTWNGAFYGNISVWHESTGFDDSYWCEGASGFTGIRVMIGRGFHYNKGYFFLGHAKKVSLCREYPFD